MKKQGRRVLFAVVLLGFVLASLFGVYQFKRAEDMALSVENQYAHSFHEMSDYIEDINVLLKKTMLVSSPRQLSSLAAEIYMQTAAAKANLAMLPTGESNLTETARFLSQAGDYTAFLSAKVINEGEITEEEYNNLSSLSAYAGKINKQIAKLDDLLYEQQLSFQKANKMAVYAEGENSSFDKGMENLEKTMQDYPSLIYDGPFSSHIEHLTPVFLENKPAISQEKALITAKSFCGEAIDKLLVYAGESNGKIKTYEFMGQGENGREISIGITQYGGYILYMLDSRKIEEPFLKVEEAKEKALIFLKKNGFENMEASYYETDGSFVTFNFAAKQQEVLLYSDLIKVKVALDNGDVLGFEAKGYLMNHQQRELPEQLLPEEEIKNKINDHLMVESVRLAMIPLDSYREVLTYECKGKYNKETFLIYINAQTGEEEKILMLMQTENGMLTI